MAEKANGNATLSTEGVFIPPGSETVSGKPFDPEDLSAAGVVQTPDGKLYGIAPADMVFDGTMTPTTGNVLRRRANTIHYTHGAVKIPDATRGAELEMVFMHPDGTYAKVVGPDGEYSGRLGDVDLTPELYTFMGETGFKESADPRETRNNIRNRLAEIAGAAEEDGLYVAPLAVFQQMFPYEDSVNPYPYVRDVVRRMRDSTGFQTSNVFRVGGAQSHQQITNSEIAPRAAELEQLLAPIMAAPSSNSPDIAGTAVGINWDSLNDKQRYHLERRGITPADLLARYAASARYILRRIGSPSAGAWDEPAPDNGFHGYLRMADAGLQDRIAPTPDRLLGGLHSDLRVRWGNKPTGTYETSAPDTYGGNPDKLWAAQQLFGSVMASIENAINRDQDPRDRYPALFGKQVGRSALALAHQHRLAAGREGMEAVMHGRRVPQHWEDLARLAHESNTFPNEAHEIMQRSFTSDQFTFAALKAWCNEHGKEPGMEAYHELGIGAPYVYMQARAEMLRERNPTITPEDLVRTIELDTAKAAHSKWLQAA